MTDNKNSSGYTIDKNGYAVPNEPVHFNPQRTLGKAAFEEGVIAGRQRKGELDNPYNESQYVLRTNWISGLKEGLLNPNKEN